jgi:hypothetical protein
MRGFSRNILLSFGAVLAVLLLLEGAVRLFFMPAETMSGVSVPVLLRQLPHLVIQDREIDNQTIAHNVALFARHPDPAAVTQAYVGTSRTKVVRPQWLGNMQAVNGSGNSYNEISYGLLLQAEVVRRMFPHVRTLYVESSLLLRRPARLIVENDHRKYLPLLQSLLPLRDALPGGEPWRAQVAAVQQQKRPWKFLFPKVRQHLRLSSLLGYDSKSMPIADDPLLKQLLSDGERVRPPQSHPGDVGPIALENGKVQRLLSIPSAKPWDGLFDMFALWGRKHDIQIIFFQPPVRSDLYAFQTQYGLRDHVRDLKRVAEQYHLPFIDLNRPSLHYMDDWDLFADEDHLETCRGVILLQAALDEGMRQYRQEGVLFPSVPRALAERLAAGQLTRCGA